MAPILKLKDYIEMGGYDPVFKRIYQSDASTQQEQKRRYMAALQAFREHFPDSCEARVFSVPGRTEVGGNHTDHNGGHILAASVDLDVIAFATKNDDNTINVISQGFDAISFPMGDFEPDESENYTSASLIKGIIARLKQLGYEAGGVNAYITSNVLKGSGLSSSAAYEVCVATIFNYLYNDGVIPPLAVAQIAQYAENVFFGKPCGLMDMTTCSVGGFVTIDFNNFEKPDVRRVDFDFASCGYKLCIVDTGGNHADLNEDYASLEREMKEVAGLLGADVLAHTSKDAMMKNMVWLRQKTNDRALLRAMHFFNDDMRVLAQVEALENGDFERFKGEIIESGLSSFTYCQNIYSNSAWKEQGISIGLAIAENVLKGCGAWRVHGGGFAGTLQAFVPENKVESFRTAMTRVFGENAFYELLVRPEGAIEITEHIPMA